MSHLWQVIETEMELLREKAVALAEDCERLRAERDAFADDVARLHKASGYDGPTRGRSSL